MSCCNKHYCRLSPLCLGFAMALMWAVMVFLMGAIAESTGYGAGFVRAVSSIYFGYQATFLGSIIGAAWAFVDAFFGGVILAWLYNVFTSWNKKEEKTEE